MKILILEDETERIKAFKEVLTLLPDVELHLWKSAWEFIEEAPTLLETTDFISLDHDLFTEDVKDPGDGLQVAEFLSPQTPVCPIFIHSTNVNRSWSMFNELKYGNWDVERKPPIGMGTEWIHKYWFPALKEKLDIKL